MIAASQSLRVTNRARLRPIALPVEHGGWSLLLEPIVLGLLLAPSLAGLFLSVGAVALFLARHPYKIVVKDWRANRRGQRAIFAKRFSISYLAIGLLAIGVAIKRADLAFLLPLLLAAPCAIVQLLLDGFGRSRALVAELAGSVATGSLATSIVVIGGWPRPTAFALWVIIAARSVPTILYLRARLRLMRQRPRSSWVAITAHLIALLMIVGLACAAVAPWLAVLAMAILSIRAIVGLSQLSKAITPQRLGIWELGFGILTVLTVVIGNRFGL